MLRPLQEQGIEGVLNSNAWFVVSTPLRWFYDAILAEGWRDLLLYGTLGLLFNLVLLGVVFSLDANYLEAAAAYCSSRIYAQLRRLPRRTDRLGRVRQSVAADTAAPRTADAAAPGRHRPSGVASADDGGALAGPSGRAGGAPGGPGGPRSCDVARRPAANCSTDRDHVRHHDVDGHDDDTPLRLPRRSRSAGGAEDAAAAAVAPRPGTDRHAGADPRRPAMADARSPGRDPESGALRPSDNARHGLHLHVAAGTGAVSLSMPLNFLLFQALEKRAVPVCCLRV